MEEIIKQKLIERGFTKKTLLNNRGLIGAVIDETKEQLKLGVVGVMFKDKKINRFEVIDKRGRAYVNFTNRPLKIEASLQDDDRTLKIFLDD